MPPVKATTANGVPVRRGRPTKVKPALSFQEPLMVSEPVKQAPPAGPAKQTPPSAEKQSSDSDRPQDFEGIPVRKEELVGNLPGVPFKISRLHLADGTMASACRDCDFAARTWSEVANHRNDEHGSRYGKGRRPMTLPIERAPDLVLSPREDGTQPGGNPLDWTFREMLALMPSIGAFVDYAERCEQERDAAMRHMGDLGKNRAKIDNYDALSDEVVELRLKIRNTGSYEQMAKELKELRDWKKKIIARLSVLGFNFNAEE